MNALQLLDDSGQPGYIQKLRVAVRLAQPNEPPRDGWLLLLPHHGLEDRAETLLELLESRRHVIPFLQAADDTVLLVSRTNIDWVAVAVGADPAHVVPPGPAPTMEQRAELRFVDESRVEVTIRWDSERKTMRLSDFLNLPGSFFPAHTGFGRLLVNKFRLRETRVIEPNARPIP